MPTKKDHLEFYKEIYYKELERRNSLNTETALQGTVLVAVVSGLFFLLTSLKTEWLWIHNLFSWLVVFAILCGSISGFFLMRSYYDFLKKGRKYSHLPFMREVNAYYQRVDKTEFNNFLQDAFIEACDSHIANNDEKSRLLTQSSRWMSYMMVYGAFSTVVFFGNYLSEDRHLKKFKKHEYQKSKSAATTATRSTGSTTANAPRAINSTTAVAPVGRARGQDTIQNKAVKGH